MATTAFRLDDAIRSVCPIEGVRIHTGGLSGEYLPKDSATSPQLSAADAVLAAFDWSQSAEDSWLNANARAFGQASLDDDRTALYKVLRAEASVLVDEINTLRQWIVAFKVQVAAATTLADLKTRVASLPNMPDRTLEQAKTAIKNTIAAGTVD